MRTCLTGVLILVMAITLACCDGVASGSDGPADTVGGDEATATDGQKQKFQESAPEELCQFLSGLCPGDQGSVEDCVDFCTDKPADCSSCGKCLDDLGRTPTCEDVKSGPCALVC